MTDLDDLVAAGRILANGGLTAEPDPNSPLDYEPRASAACDRCAQAWVASKAGEIVRIRIGESLATKAEDRIRLPSCVRDLVHVHDAPGPLLVSGTDDGYLDVFSLADSPTRPVRLDISRRTHHFETLTPSPKNRESRPLDFDKTHGITALYSLEQAYADPSILLLVATRSPELLLVHLRRRHDQWQARTVASTPAPGWVSWFLRGRHGARAEPQLVTESGERAWISVRRRWGWFGPLTLRLTRLDPAQVLPTAAFRLRDDVLLVGCSVGLLAILEDGTHHVVPVTGTEVLSIGRWGDAIALGLADGRVKVVPTNYIHQLALGQRPYPPPKRDVHLSAGAVLHLFTCHHSGDERALFAATRDHQVVHIRSHDVEDIGARVLASLGFGTHALAARPVHARTSAALSDKLHAVSKRMIQQRTPREIKMWRHAEIAVLPALQPQHQRDWLKQRTHLPEPLDQRAIRRLSYPLMALPDSDASELVRTSAMLLEAMLHLPVDTVDRAVRDHVRDIKHTLAQHGLSDKGRERVTAWIRFLRKYVLDGATFATKRLNRRALVEHNARIGKPTDALIYEALLYQERFDLQREASLHHGPVALCAVDGASGQFVVATDDGRILIGGDQPLQKIDGPQGGPVLALAATATDAGMRIVVVRKDRIEVGKVRRSMPVWSMEFDRKEDACAVVSVPGDPDQFVVGLQRESQPLALLHRAARGWEVLPIEERTPRRSGTARTPLRAPGRTFCRVAVTIYDGTRYALVGTETGTVDVVDLDGMTYVNDAPLELRSPVSAVTLATVPDGPKTELTCYLGTTRGFLYAVQVRPEAPDTWHHVWRETIDEPITAIRVWRCPTYPDPADRVATIPRQILALVGESGRVSLHEVGQYYDGWPVSESGNVTFLGLRLDRLRLPGPIVDVQVVHDSTSFVAVTRDRRVLEGVFCNTRDSTERAPTHEGAWSRQGIWQRLDRLYRDIRLDQPLVGKGIPWSGPALLGHSDPGKARLLLLIHHTTGGIGRYVMRRLLWGPHDHPATEVTPFEGIAAVIQSLDLAHPPGRQLLKVAVKALARRGIGIGVGRLNADPHADGDLERAVEILRTCFAALVARPGLQARYLRITLIKEVLRPNLLAHVARASSGSEVRSMMRDMLGSCLTDDNRVVRVEALRAISVCLRNLVAWSRQESIHIEDVFPHGVEDLAWMVEQVDENLRGRGNVSVNDVLFDGWSYTTVMICLLKLFPSHTFALCERFARVPGHTSYLQVVATRLRGMTNVELLHRKVCRYLAADPQTLRPLERRPFLAAYRRPVARLVQHHAHRPPTGEEQAAYTSYTRLWALACLWRRRPEALEPAATEVQQALVELDRDRATGIQDGPSEVLRPPIDDVLATLVRLGHNLVRHHPRPHAGDTIDETRQAIDALPGLLEHERHATSGILDSWEAEYVRRWPVQGDEVEHMPGWRLGPRLGVGANGVVFRAISPDSVENGVIKVSSHVDSRPFKTLFCNGAKINLSLSPCSRIVTVRDGSISTPDQAFAAYAMDYYDRGDLRAHYAAARRHGRESAAVRPVELACRVARDIVPALAYAHRARVAHRDIHAGNVLARRVAEGRPMQFGLADFELAHEGSGTPAALGIRSYLGIPAEQLAPQPGQSLLDRHRHLDVVQLAGMLARMMGSSDLDATEFEPEVLSLPSLGNGLAPVWRPGFRALREAVEAILTGQAPWRDADALLKPLAALHVVRVFLCYAKNDRPAVLDFRDAIVERCGSKIHVFVDVDMDAGVEWERRVLPELRSANLFVVFQSHHMTQESYSVRMEIPEARVVRQADPDEFVIAPLQLSEPDPKVAELTKLEGYTDLANGVPLDRGGFDRAVDRLAQRVEELRKRLQALT